MFYRGYKFVDVDQVYQKGTIANKFWQKRDLVFPELCMMMIKNHLNAIPRGNELLVKVNRLVSQEENVMKNDKQGKMTIFGQVCREISEGKPDFENFRISGENPNHSCMKIKFKNERAVDIGGPFREVITNMVKEIETDKRLSLFKPSRTQNGLYVINEGANDEYQLELFIYVGAFMAYAFLSSQPVPFSLTANSWRLILGEDTTGNEEDLSDRQ